MPTLEAVDVYRFYHVADEETLALRGVSLSVDAGELVALMGPSGSGKSTLLACLAGLDEPDGGFVEVSGVRLTRRPERERAAMRARSIGIVLQTDNLIGHLTTEDNIGLPMRLARSFDRRHIEELLELTGLRERRRALPAQLSGGELARAAFAAALASRPDVLLADEPTGEVDAENERRMLDLLASGRRDGRATLVATHSDAVAACADRVVWLRDGSVRDAQ